MRNLRGSSRAEVVLGGVYAAGAVVLAFADRIPLDVDVDSLAADIVFGCLILAQPVFGFFVPRWWALLLPYAGLAAILPFSRPIDDFFGLTEAGAAFFGGFFAMLLVAFGIACRLTLDAFREPR